jgi:lantibiotic leader peptide-processing serine protease
MNKRHFLVLGIGLTLLLSIPFTGFGEHWILNHNSNTLPSDLEEIIGNAGGRVVKTLDEIGVVLVEFTKQEDVRTTEACGFEVMPDVLLNWLNGNPIPEGEHIWLNENYYANQWHLGIIQAEDAWAQGVSGAGIRVALVDTGIWYYHPDLYANIDFAAGATFVPDTLDFLDDNGHGTHIAGIIAAADNEWGTIGVAPETTLIPIKVLGADGIGRISWFIEGIIHAVRHNAHIINLSLGYYLHKNGCPPYYTACEASYLRRVMRKLINWAAAQGVLVVNSAGNAGLNLNHCGAVISIPTEEGNGIVVSATGPNGTGNFDELASYSNYGTSVILVSAPGGDFRNYPESGWWNDMIFSTNINGWMWSAGTSSAASIVTGVAALVLEKYGPMSPAQLRSHLAHSTDDIGRNGKDPYFGNGRINAYKAVTQ